MIKLHFCMAHYTALVPNVKDSDTATFLRKRAFGSSLTSGPHSAVRYAGAKNKVIVKTKNKRSDLMQLRKCVFTWNNYLDEHAIDDGKIRCSFADRESVIDYFSKLDHMNYVSLGWEVGDEGTPHIQGYIHFTSPKHFKTLVTYMGKNHIEKVYGTNQQAIDYTQEDSDFTEIGERPLEKGGRTDLAEFFKAVEDGMTNKELRAEYPSLYGLHYKKVKDIRLELLEERFSKEHRNVSVYYIYGDSGIGKTRAIYDRFDIHDIYRVPHYNHGMFDGYMGEDVLVLDEFTGGIKFTELMQYLDRYPVKLNARYKDPVACFTKVFIISNEPLNEWYQGIQQYQYTSYQAFLRRINGIADFNDEVEKGLMENAIMDMLHGEDEFIQDALDTFGDDFVRVS
jgi:hypothetical protein